jgi:mannosyltransferase
MSGDDGGAARGESAVPRRIVAAAVAVVALLVLGWRLTRPALWLDETASVLATQRHWGELFRLLHSTDAPLVPYYALLKATSGLTTTLWPGAAGHPELLYRWPSVLVCALAAGLFALWLGREAGPRVAVGASAILLLCASTSFYAQDARPYAFALAAAVAASAVWTRLIAERRRRWVVLYAVCVAVLIDAHLLAGLLLVVHLLAALIQPGASRWRGVVRTAVGGGIGLVVGAPFALFAAGYGRGVAGGAVTRHKLFDAFNQLFTDGQAHSPGRKLILLLALVGLARFRSGRYGALSRLAGCWAVVPLLLFLPVVALRPGLLQVRYLLFVLPGWALLAGIGLATVMDAVARVWRLGAAPLVAAGAGVVLVAAVLSQQQHGLRAVRSPAGHGEDVRPGLALAASPPYAGLPIALTLGNSALEVAVYAPRDVPRLYGLEVQRTRASIWPTRTPAAQRERQLAPADRVVVLARKGSLPGDCPADPRAALAPQLAGCLPKQLLPAHFGYRVVSAAPGGLNWTFVVLQR